MKTKIIKGFDKEPPEKFNNEYPTSHGMFRAPWLMLVCGVRNSGKGYLTSKKQFGDLGVKEENVYELNDAAAASLSEWWQSQATWTTPLTMAFGAGGGVVKIAEAINNVRSTLVCEKEKKENYSAEATNRKSPPGRPDAHNESPHFRPAPPPGCPQPISTNFRDGASGRFRTSALRAASKCRHFLGLQNVGASRHLDVKVVHGRPSTNPTLLSVKT